MKAVKKFLDVAMFAADLNLNKDVCHA